MITQWNSGITRVRGTYCGHEVVGTVEDGRGFPRGNKTQLLVILDAPIYVYGQIRKSVTLTDDDNVRLA